MNFVLTMPLEYCKLVLKGIKNMFTLFCAVVLGVAGVAIAYFWQTDRTPQVESRSTGVYAARREGVARFWLEQGGR